MRSYLHILVHPQASTLYVFRQSIYKNTTTDNILEVIILMQFYQEALLIL